jgi:hypothetical protein
MESKYFKRFINHHILTSSAETMGCFNTIFHTVNLHRPTKPAHPNGDTTDQGLKLAQCQVNGSTVVGYTRPLFSST